MVIKHFVYANIVPIFQGNLLLIRTKELKLNIYPLKSIYFLIHHFLQWPVFKGFNVLHSCCIDTWAYILYNNDAVCTYKCHILESNFFREFSIWHDYIPLSKHQSVSEWVSLSVCLYPNSSKTAKSSKLEFESLLLIKYWSNNKSLISWIR